MKFAFLIHPISSETRNALRMLEQGSDRQGFKNVVGTDVFSFFQALHERVVYAEQCAEFETAPEVRVIDELNGLCSAQGAQAEGRLYEIPMDAIEMLENQSEAMDFIQEAIDQATHWGAKIVGLGAMTGIVGGQGKHLAESNSIPVTTGNSLTVFAALENFFHTCRETNIDLQKETISVVGVPGSIATALAKLLRDHCQRLILVGRRPSLKSKKLAASLDAELVFDIPQALSQSRIIFSATSSGDCIDQDLLLPGSIVVDVAVPTDVKGGKVKRPDILVLSGGLARVPKQSSLDSNYLYFHQGMVPSCMAETMLLGMTDREECYSIGRELNPEKILAIGELAKSHGFDFSRLFSFGLPLEDKQLIRFQKSRMAEQRLLAQESATPVAARTETPRNGKHSSHAGNGKASRVNGRKSKPAFTGNGAATNGNGHATGGKHVNGRGSANGNGATISGNGNAASGNGSAVSSNGSAATEGTRSQQAMSNSLKYPEPNTNPMTETSITETQPTEGPVMEQLSQRAQNLYARYINPVLIEIGASSNFVKTFVRGEDTYLWDDTGKQYTDFVAGFGSMNLGHNHPAVTSAIKDALRQQAPGFAQSAVNPLTSALAEELVLIAPGELDMVFFCNSGSEAVEAGIKMARLATGRTGLVSCHKSYHGKTLGALSLTGNPEYQRPFGPLLPGCRQIPYGDLEALECALADRDVAAFLVEPLQAEGGMFLPAEDYLREAKKICQKYDTLLLVDEVQTGFGRTGKMFAVEHSQTEPDIMTLAKSLGGGCMPIGAMLVRRDLWKKAYGTIGTFALHTSTFSGGSLACAAGLAVLKVLREEKLIQNAADRGQQLLKGLAKVCDQPGSADKVRGQGLLIGLEFKKTPPGIHSIWKEVAASGGNANLIPGIDTILENSQVVYVMRNLLEEYGFYTQVARSNPRVLRVQPPLTIRADQVDQFIRSVQESCRELEVVNRMFDGITAKSGLGQHQASQRKSLLSEMPSVIVNR